MNQHAAALEKLLGARKIPVTKIGNKWRLSANGKVVIYKPLNGYCERVDPLDGRRKNEELRGSPGRVAEILQGFIA